MIDAGSLYHTVDRLPTAWASSLAHRFRVAAFRYHSPSNTRSTRLIGKPRAPTAFDRAFVVTHHKRQFGPLIGRNSLR